MKLVESNVLTLKENYGMPGRIEGLDMDITITSGGHDEFDGDLNHRVIKMSIRGWKIISVKRWDRRGISIEYRLVRKKFVCPKCWGEKVEVNNKMCECGECHTTWRDPTIRGD